MHNYLHWKIFVGVIWPTLIGSLFLAVPSALIIYFVMRMLVSYSRAPQKSN